MNTATGTTPRKTRKTSTYSLRVPGGNLDSLVRVATEHGMIYSDTHTNSGEAVISFRSSSVQQARTTARLLRDGAGFSSVSCELTTGLGIHRQSEVLDG